MKSRVKCVLIVGSEADAISVASDLDAWLAANAAWRVDIPPRVVLRADEWLVVCEAEYEGRASADNFRSRIEQRWGSGPLRNLILPGSWVHVHDCRHEDGEGYCEIAPADWAVKT